MTVQELIDKLKYFDKDMKVVGVNEVKLDTMEKTEVVCHDYQVSIKRIGFETVVNIK
jgi:kynurenine formamidase